MTYKPLYAFTDALEGKTVRFKAACNLPNLSSQFGISKTHPDNLHVPAGALAVVYEVRGGTLFVGFGRDLKKAPDNPLSPTSFDATAQVYLEDMHLLETTR